MALTITNPTYLTAAPSKTGQVLAPNEQSNLEVAFAGVATVTLDGTLTTGTINFIDGTQTIFANGDAAGTTTAPRYVEAAVVGGTQSATAFIQVATGAVTTTGFTFYLSTAGTAAKTIVVLFNVYK